MPAVSICIPTYNHAAFIGDALRSAMAQSCDDAEIVVLDNASQDNTQEIVKEISARDPRIRYIRHSRNIGLIPNLNACIEFAEGRYVKILCADDLLHPGCVSAMSKALDDNPGVSLVACARTVADENLATLRIVGSREHQDRIAGATMIANCFFWGNRIGEPTAVIFRRADSQRGFNQNYPQLVDMEMWFHLLRKGDFLALPQSLCTIRSHSGQATWDNDQNGRIVGDRKRLFREFAGSTAISAGFSKKMLWDLRMAYALMRSAAAESRTLERPVQEVFFPRAFPLCTYPFMSLMKSIGLRRIWRTI